MTLTTTPAEIVGRAESSGTPGLLGRHPTWARIAVGSLVRIVNGAPFSSRLFNTSGVGVPLIRIRDVGLNSPLTFYDGPFDPTMLVRAGDLLVGMDGDFRLARWTGPEALLNQRVCRLEVTSAALDERWLFYALQGYLDAIWAETSSVTVKHLSSKSIAKVPLPLPTLAEQRRIVDLLEAYLSQLEGAEASLAAVDRRLRALRSSQLEAIKRVAAAVGPVTSLSEIAVEARYGTSAKCVVGGPGVPVVRIPNLAGGCIDLTTEKCVEDPTCDMSGLMLEAGDVLVVRTNGSRDLVGRAAVVQPGINAAFASYLIRYRVDERLVHPLWVRTMLEAPSTREALESMAASSAGQFNLGLKKLDSVALPVPPLSMQSDLLESADATLGAIARLGTVSATARSRAIALRASLLTAAFSGRLTEGATALQELAHV